ncbi:hypothetical protein PoB_005888800 [Plakobranchus ocellatus]|uniref:Uncharacterized protein n=1 Tax=Plakobranchus ocellatus TaxID=259542 RepID=A0AAV4CM91_9GAST|nr:hypothetical protein PoB_005888800 [Plakobranchus ocellatus]
MHHNGFFLAVLVADDGSAVIMSYLSFQLTSGNGHLNHRTRSENQNKGNGSSQRPGFGPVIIFGHKIMEADLRQWSIIGLAPILNTGYYYSGHAVTGQLTFGHNSSISAGFQALHQASASVADDYQQISRQFHYPLRQRRLHVLKKRGFTC